VPAGGATGASAVTTEGHLLPDLRSLGLRPGDLVMVHASLRRLGLAAKGGAERLLDALDEAVGREGTLLMLLGTQYEQDWVNERPEAERAALLEGTPPFDPVTALANRDVGWLAEAFRRRAGTIVTGNPSGRFGARGRDAAALLADAPWHDYYGPGSPLARLCERGGRILRLGADPDTVTALHYAEYLARVPAKRRVRWEYLVQGESGPERVHTACLDDSQGIAAWEGEDYFKLILSDYLAAGRARTGRVGAAQSELIEAADIVGFGARWMERHLT
jgi:aminoglycoside N3'-acetyltransferase